MERYTAIQARRLTTKEQPTVSDKAKRNYRFNVRSIQNAAKNGTHTCKRMRTGCRNTDHEVYLMLLNDGFHIFGLGDYITWE